MAASLVHHKSDSKSDSTSDTKSDSKEETKSEEKDKEKAKEKGEFIAGMNQEEFNSFSNKFDKVVNAGMALT